MAEYTRETLAKDFDMKLMDEVAEEIRKECEANPMTETEITAAFSTRYARKIDAVEQTDFIFNPTDTANARVVRRFKHSPLLRESEIRLFKYKKTVWHGSRPYYSCEIVHVNLDDSPVYNALSYTWGPIEDAATILIGDDQCLQVTKALEKLLMSFSTGTTVADYFWTDQLCINQYDLQERNKQVALMGRVYGQAKVTVLWLGEEDKTAEQAFSLIHCFDSVLSRNPGVTYQDLFFNAGSFSAEDIRQKFHSTFPHAEDVPPSEDPRWKSLVSLLERPWFTRLWVFQEALLSSAKTRAHISCGTLDCSMVSLHLATSLLFVDWELPSIPPGLRLVPLLMQYYMYREIDSFPSLSFTLWQIGGILRSRNPRDRVYGLLGIQSSEKAVHIPIDYTKSVQDVYTDCMRRLIDHDGNLRVLEFIKRNSKGHRVPDLPTWVPDWSAEVTSTPLETSGDTRDLQNGRFMACKHLRYHPNQPEPISNAFLAVKGKVVDKVVTLIQSLGDEFQIGFPSLVEKYFAENFPVSKWAILLHNNIALGYLPDATPDELKAIIIRTITADGFDKFNSLAMQEESAALPTRRPTLEADALEAFDELNIMCHLWNNGQYVISGGPKELHQKMWMTTEVCKGRALAMLSKFWLALAPQQVQPGDCICVLHGSTVPWVLRPMNEEGKYEVVGQCFVDGMMYGEAVNWEEDEANTFVLV